MTGEERENVTYLDCSEDVHAVRSYILYPLAHKGIPLSAERDEKERKDIKIKS